MSRVPLHIRILAMLLTAIAVLQIAWNQPSEPFFNGDETRHVATSVFVHDALRDGGYWHPKQYAERYYAQYPSLGLFVWPPGFYAVCGSVMLVCGATFETARGVNLAYCLLAVSYAFYLIRRTHGLATATIACVLLAVSRDVFAHTRAVMLEVPTLACFLGVAFHLERYLASRKRIDLIWLGIWTVAMGYHRYDAVMLISYFGIRLLFRGELRLMFRREVLVTGAIAALALAPYYYLAMTIVGATQAQAASTGTNPSTVHSDWGQFVFYLSQVWFQIGTTAFLFACVGLVASYKRSSWDAAKPYWAMLAAVYITFTPMAEQETRHAIYWIPAWCAFAAEASLFPARYGYRRALAMLSVFVLITASACWTLRQPVPWVRGYAKAVQFVLNDSQGTKVCLFDGLMDGTFICEMRRADASRRIWVLRGDKLLYAVRSDPNAEYVEWAEGEAGVLKLLREADPDTIVIEDPPIKYSLPMARLLRETLAKHPELYEVVATFPIDANNLEWLQNKSLIVYRPLQRTPMAERKLKMRMLWQGTTLEAEIPK